MPIERYSVRTLAVLVAPGAVLTWCFLVAVLLLAPGAASPLLAQGVQDYIVTFREGTTPDARAVAVRNVGAAVRFNYRGIAAAAVRVPNANALAALRNNPSVVAVIPDRPVSAYQRHTGKPGGGGGKPGGGSGASQVVPAGIARVGAPIIGSDGSGIGVAIVDTGIDLSHPDLAGTVDAFNAFDPEGSCQDDEGHGTHVAGTVAARDNSIDVVGVAPNAHLFCVKVLNASGSGSDATVMAGLDWVLTATTAPAIKVVNMSLGRPGSVNDNPALHALIQDLVSAGIAVVVAAGNDSSMDVSEQIPAAYPDVISVASTTARTGSNQCRFLSSPIAADTSSYFSTDGSASTSTFEGGEGVTVSAPGEDQEDVNKGCWIKSVGILSTRLGGGTTRMSGTSMAAPHVSGIVARYFQQYAGYGYTPELIRQYLKDDADGIGTAPRDSPTGSYSFDGVREGIAQAP